MDALFILAIALMVIMEITEAWKEINFMKRNQAEKKKESNVGIRKRIRQTFCNHDPVWMRKNTLFYNLRGEEHYLVCRKCEKILDKRFVEYDYDGRGFK